MPKNLTAHNDTERVRPTTLPHYLFFFDFAVPVRLSTRGTVAFSGNTYTGAGITNFVYSLDGQSGSLSLTDAASTWVGDFVSEGASGIVARAWMLYGTTASWSPGDEDLILDGELGPSREKDGVISISVVPPEFRFAPGIYLTRENGLNHLPPDGTRVRTRDGFVELRNE